MPIPARARIAIALLALALSASAGAAQTWDYKSYKKNGAGGNFSKENFVLGTLSLEERDGKASVRLIAGTVDACLRGEIPVRVERADAATTIELQQPLAGCEAIRYVIRNDGSGGDREVRRGDQWVKDGWDHLLTPRP